MKKITIFQFFLLNRILKKDLRFFFFFFLPSAASESEVTRAQALGCKAPKIAILATENPKK